MLDQAQDLYYKTSCNSESLVKGTTTVYKPQQDKCLNKRRMQLKHKKLSIGHVRSQRDDIIEIIGSMLKINVVQKHK